MNLSELFIRRPVMTTLVMGALLIFGLDAPLPGTVLDQIKSSKHILSVKVADLSKGL